MDNNKIIAKALYRIAKELVSANVANAEGKYENFTGQIKWSGSSGKVQNATFELNEDDGILWKNGTWKSGTWFKGKWDNGTWEGDTWTSGTWKNGTWERGTWEDGIWWKGNWQSGTWEFGSDKSGKTYGKDYSPDLW